MNSEKKEFGGWWLFILALVVLTFGVFSVTNFFGTAMERKVFETSYQRSESQKTKIATYQAQLASIESQIATSNDDAFIKELKAQQAMLNVLLNVARKTK